MKRGMKLNEFTPVITEYEDASGFPDEQSANSYCKEMNNQSFGWTVEKGLLAELFLPSRPEVRVGATISCPKCQTVVSYVQPDLRYLASD